MNKSMLTNVLCLIAVALGYTTHNEWLLSAGLFALSGAITNWLAIHMLFEKVPGLYGSGVIPLRFEAFKASIKRLMMDQFFTQENIGRFIEQELEAKKTLDFKPILSKLDFNPTFDSLVDVIMNSSFGGMLAMMGGAEALAPMKTPFVEKMQSAIAEMSESEVVQQALAEQFGANGDHEKTQQHIESIIDQRLSELTPQLVKQMVQAMIKEHLGWLVVWGGVFGGVIGLGAHAI